MKPNFSSFLQVTFVFFVGASLQLTKGKQTKCSSGFLVVVSVEKPKAINYVANDRKRRK